MAPKKEFTARETYLVSVIKNSAQKLVINWDAVAKETGMSPRGAQNKITLVLKEFEEAGAKLATNDGAGATAGAKAGVKRKRASKTATAGGDVEGGPAGAKVDAGGVASEEDAPAKKRVARKRAPGVEKSAAVIKSDDEGGEVEGGAPITQAAAKTKAKATVVVPKIATPATTIADAKATKKAPPKPKAKAIMSPTNSADEANGVPAEEDKPKKKVAKEKPKPIKRVGKGDAPLATMIDVETMIVKAKTLAAMPGSEDDDDFFD